MTAQRIIGFFVFTLCSFASLASAGTRDYLFVQGVLFDDFQDPVDATLAATFRLYETPTGVEPLWEESQLLTIKSGIYSAALGSVTPFPSDLFEKEDLYLGIQFEGDTEMTPRFGLYAVPFAQQSEVAMTAMSLVDNAVTGDSIAPGAIISTHIAEDAIGRRELAPTGVIPGTYTLATITVTANGRITSASNGSAVQLDASGALPAVSGENLTNLNASQIISGTLPDGRLSTNVSLLGSSIESAEIASGTITNENINGAAAISGTKINPNFGSQDITTTGDLVASGGFKMMIGPFVEIDVQANGTKHWDVGDEGNVVERVAMPWAGSVMGISVRCNDTLTSGTLDVQPTINGTGTGLTATVGAGQQNNVATQAKDADPFSANDFLGCEATSTDVNPSNTRDCACFIFVEM